VAGDDERNLLPWVIVAAIVQSHRRQRPIETDLLISALGFGEENAIVDRLYPRRACGRQQGGTDWT
jgi:hypothetical protein